MRGLASDGRCPECGKSITSSLRGTLLKHADADWLDTLQFGVSLKLWNIALLIILGIAGGLLVAFGFPVVLLTLGGLVGGALGLWASFVITTQEPRISLQEDTVTLRKIVRSCAAAAFVGGLLNNVNALGSPGSIAQIVSWILSLAGLIAAFGELLYLRRFAMRIPDEKLAKSTKILMWAIPIAGAFGIIVGIVVALLGVAPPAPGTAATPPPYARRGAGRGSHLRLLRPVGRGCVVSLVRSAALQIQIRFQGRCS